MKLNLWDNVRVLIGGKGYHDATVMADVKYGFILKWGAPPVIPWMKVIYMLNGRDLC